MNTIFLWDVMGSFYLIEMYKCDFKKQNMTWNKTQGINDLQGISFFIFYVRRVLHGYSRNCYDLMYISHVDFPCIFIYSRV